MSHPLRAAQAAVAALALAAAPWAGCTALNTDYQVPGAAPDLSGQLGDFSFAAPTCTDGQKNGQETDVDCGGPACPACLGGKACLVGADCSTLLCDDTLHICASCSDGERDGQETDVDCGGPTCSACGLGKMCIQGSDCASFGCVNGTCAQPASCNAIKVANAASLDGTYIIDPDGPGGLAPFMVYCDMTTMGGGWTALPLAFADATLWQVKHSGSDCQSPPKMDRDGSLLTFQNASAAMWSYMAIKFLPPMQVRQVWLKNLTHSTATACNNMDILQTEAPKDSGDETAEGWYFSADDVTSGLGFVFFDGCNTPHYSGGGGGMNAECSMDTIDTTVQINKQVKLSKPTTHFTMVAVEGCGSSVCDANSGQAERFYIDHPAPKSGVWKDGILVR